MNIPRKTTARKFMVVSATIMVTILFHVQESLAFATVSKFPTSSTAIITAVPVSRSLFDLQRRTPSIQAADGNISPSSGRSRRFAHKRNHPNDDDPVVVMDGRPKIATPFLRKEQLQQQQQQQLLPLGLGACSKWMSHLVLATALLLGGGMSPSFITTTTTTGVHHHHHWLPNVLIPPPANAFEGSKVIGKLSGSGLVFKDSLQIERFEDPKVKGVVLYISNFDRPITEKLGGNFFNDPAYASVACAKTGKDTKIAIADNIALGPQGEEVFEESRSLLFKTLRVQRIYDTETNTVVYVSYNTRLDKSDDTNKSRFKSSLCAVNLNDT